MSQTFETTRTAEKILGIVYGIGMNVNNILGSGIVTAPGIIWKATKHPGIVLLLWFIGGVVSMSGALTYVELGAMHKVSGGETKYLYTAFPNPKFMMSYIFSLTHILAIRPGILCAILQSAAQYFWYTVMGHRYDLDMEQDKDGWHLPFSPFWVIKLIAIALLFIMTVYHMINNKLANHINQALAAIKLVTYSIIAITGIYKLFLVNRINWQQSLSGSTDITSYSTSILLILFSYDGWNSLNYSLDEFQKPEKNLIFSNSISVGIVTLIYLLVNIAFISVVPESSIIDSTSDETIAATFFRYLFGESEVIIRIFTGLVVLSVFGTAASVVWGGSRIIVAVAELNFFPKYSRELRTWNDRFDTPVNALLAQFIWCSFVIFIGSSFTITGYTLFSIFSMYSYWIFYSATGVGLLVIQRRLKKEQPQKEQPQKQQKRNNNNNNENDIENSDDSDDSNNSDNSNNPNNSDNSKGDHYKVPLPVALTFILAGMFILTFSFIVENDQKIQKLSPIFISFGFLILAIIFWHFLYHKKIKKMLSMYDNVEK